MKEIMIIYRGPCKNFVNQAKKIIQVIKKSFPVDFSPLPAPSLSSSPPGSAYAPCPIPLKEMFE